MIRLQTPLSPEETARLRVGDTVLISGGILCGRDAVLPKILQKARENALNEIGVDLEGQVIFHTAVSPAGIGPTSSNKAEIEESIVPLSAAGVRLHLGKGRLKPETVEGMARFGAVYAVIPPVTALLGEKTKKKECLAFPELGMEALWRVEADGFPAVIAAAGGRSLYEK